MLDFKFSNSQTVENIDASARVLVQPRLWVPDGDYPAYTEWMDKALSQLETGSKRAMVAWWGKEAIGSIVYQLHPKRNDVVEIKNISIEDRARGRHVASFLLSQVEHEAVVEFPEAKLILADTKATNTSMVAFAIQAGFSLDAPKILDSNFMHNGVPDIRFSKCIA